METTNTAMEAEATMKFIIKGRTFDTATSSVVAFHRGSYIPTEFSGQPGVESVRFEDTLFRTAKGTFWVHEHNTAKHMRGKPVVTDEATELVDAATALRWVQDRGAVLVDDTGLELPPEA